MNIYDGNDFDYALLDNLLEGFRLEVMKITMNLRKH